MRPDHIVIHHSLTEDGTTVSWGAIRKYHLHKGWIDVGYHFGLELIGDHYEILMGRMQEQTGAHCREEGMNRRSLGICVVGNFDFAPPPDPALDQLAMLVKSLQGIWSIPIENVKRHTDFATYKSCPGKLFPWEGFISMLED
ncbi:MAG: N-acetylmuramoyl-L-alanine amidase [Acidobacteria bacterium]|nr:N-acetylmuramoyl-L-alanine amidase [Acidobacteriota bacterium]